MKEIEVTPLRLSALLMSGVAFMAVVAFGLLMSFAGLGKEINLVLATGSVALIPGMVGSIMQLITPEPDKPYNAHKAQLEHEAKMAEIELEKMRLQAGPISIG